MNNIDIFLKKRKYKYSAENDSTIKSIFDDWMDEHPDYIIHYVSNSKSDIYCVIINCSQHIIWDASFWDLFSQFIYIIDEDILSLKFDYSTIIENSGYLISIFSKYLSNKFNYYESLSNQLENYAEMCGYNILWQNLNKNPNEKEKYSFSIKLCKLFVFWHEVAHIEFQKYDSTNGLYKETCEQVYSLLDHLPTEVFKDIPFFKKILTQIEKRKIPPDLLEELSADLRAFQRLASFKNISENKKNFETLLFSFISLINFIIIKSTIDKHWDIYINKHKNTMLSFIEILTLRRTILPNMICMIWGIPNLGNSLLFDFQIKHDNIDLFFKNLSIINNEWFIKSILEINHKIIYTPKNSSEILLFNTIISHMLNITYVSSNKRLKYLFNKAHNIQHSSNSLDCIPLYFEYIDCAVKSTNQSNLKNVSDTYARIAKVYAENDNFVSSQIFINNAIDIIEKIPAKDISFAFLYNNIANVFLLLKKFDNAIKFYNISLNLRISGGEQQSINIATTNSNLGDVYFKMGDYIQSLMHYLIAYQILKTRYDNQADDIKRLKENLKFFSEIPSNVSKIIIEDSIPLSTLKRLYEKYPNNIEILKEYLLGIVRDLLILPFDEASTMYVELNNLIKENRDCSLIGIPYLAFTNFQKQLINELQS